MAETPAKNLLQGAKGASGAVMSSFVSAKTIQLQTLLNKLYSVY